jgi:hypothetical protein
MKDLELGNEIYCMGCLGIITGKTNNNFVVTFHRLVSPELNKKNYKTIYTEDIAYEIHKDLVEPIIWNIFKIGDHVKATYTGNRGFQGIITAFELANNRAVCASDRCEDRVRYGYKPNEIEKAPATFCFEVNRVYNTTDGRNLRFIENQNEYPYKRQYFLLDTNTGIIVMTVSREMDISLLKASGIIFK